ncbi:hypothetical protein ACH5RR_031017 [Cinchona calisaya]|uniref:Pectinesterase inhibitor domain-containing protein n=1 Tax=Cinchona calisaya TaxID=153742 RepID=A0ABD2YHF9_9GENT
MEPQICQRLLFITISSLLVFNFQHSKFVQNVAAETDFFPESSPNLQPAISPSPEADSPAEQDISPSPTALPPLGHISFPPSESYPPSESNSPDEEISPSISEDSKPPSEALSPSNFDNFPDALPPSANIEPEIKKICNSTDYPSLCLSTIVPLLNGKTNVFSVLEIAIKASNEYAKFVLSTVKKLASIPGTPHEIVSVLNDCKDSYEDVVYNFDKTMNALTDHDIGTMNTMLSAVMTDAGDCEDNIKGANFPCPVSEFSEKLINMTSNCLAIISLTH